MKKLVSLVSVLALLVLISGCATSATDHAPAMAVRTVGVPNKLPTKTVLQAAVDVAKSLDLPAPTSVDNDSGIVSFSGPVGGVTAQVLIISGVQAQITVSDSSSAGQSGAEQTAEKFAAALDGKLKSL